MWWLEAPGKGLECAVNTCAAAYVVAVAGGGVFVGKSAGISGETWLV